MMTDASSAILTPGDRDAAIDTLAAAFHDYPVMRFVLADVGSTYREHLEALVGYFLDKRFARGWPVLGAKDGEHVVVAAAMDPPQLPGTERAPDPEATAESTAGATAADASVAAARESAVSLIGDAAWSRLEHYATAANVDVPLAPHFSLGIMGVRPGLQRAGFGRAVLDEIFAMSKRDPWSTGVYLNTEAEENVRLYEHLGFFVVAEREAGTPDRPLRTWSMFWPDAAPTSGGEETP